MERPADIACNNPNPHLLCVLRGGCDGKSKDEDGAHVIFWKIFDP